MNPNISKSVSEDTYASEAQSASRALFACLPVPSLLIDKKSLEILECNSSAKDNYEVLASATGVSFLDLHISEDRPKIHRILEVAEGRPSSYRATLRLSSAPEIFTIGLSSFVCEQTVCLIAQIVPVATAEEITKHKTNIHEVNREVAYTLDLEGRFTSISPSAEKLIGHPVEETLHQSYEKFIAPEWLPSIHRKFQSHLEGKFVPPYQTEIITRDGQRRLIEVDVTLIRQDGKPVGMMGIARDVIEHKLAERTIRESESRFRAMAESTAAAIFIHRDSRILYANNAAERITGYSTAELYRMSPLDLVHPNFRQQVQRSEDGLLTKHISSVRNEFQIITKSGELRWLELSAATIEIDGAPATIGSAFDITESKLNREDLFIQKTNLEKLIESAPEGIVIMDEHGRAVRANTEFARMFGCSPQEINGRTLDGFIIPDFLRAEARALADAMANGKAFSKETVRHRKDGTLIDVSILAKPIELSPGKVGRFVIYRNITPERRAERLRHAQFATTRILSESTTLSEAFDDLLETLGKRFGWEYSRMWLKGQQGPSSSWNIENAPPLKEVPEMGQLAQNVIASGDSLWITDIDEAGRWPKNVVLETGIVSLFCFPIRAATGIIGAFEFLSRTLRPPDFELLNVVTDIGAQVGHFIDRKNAESAVIESEAKFRAVADSAATVILIFDGSRLLYVNRAMEVATGYTRDELLSMELWNLIYPDDVAVLQERGRLRREGIDFSPRFEFRVNTRSGELRWIEYSAAPVMFEGSTAVLATAFDITERKRSERLRNALYLITALAGNSEDLNTLFKGIHEIIGELMYAKNFYIALLDDDTQTIEFPYFVDEFDPEPPPAIQRNRGLTDYVLRNGQTLFVDPLRFEELIDSGEVELVGAPSIDWLGVPLRTGDKTFGVIVVQSYSEQFRFGIAERDILMFVSQQIAHAIENRRNQDALTKSEARYRSQVQNALYGLFRSSIDGFLMDANPAFAAMLGYDSPDEMLGINLKDNIYVKPSERDEFLKRMGNSKMKTIPGLETNWRRKDGRAITVRLSGWGGIRNPGEPVCFEMVAEDITERRQLEAQLRQSQKMEAVGRLAGGIAHDFNNMLTVIKGYSDLILTELQMGNKLRTEVEEIKRAADRAASLTRQLLAFSRKQVMEPRVIDLNTVVKNMDRLLRRLIGEDIDLYTVLHPELGFVKADPGQLEQVIMNLAVNARDAMPTGGRLTIETKNIELDERYIHEHGLSHIGKYAMVAVTDTGTGMNEEVRSHIFEPFFTTKEAGKGTGLGLSTAYGIVEQSGGHIFCYSELGHGTTFKVYLPITSEIAEAAKTRTQPTSLLVGQETILLIEDEDGVRALMQEVLERSGYRILKASNGTEALDLAAGNKAIDLIVCDVVLAQVSGPDVAKQIVEMSPQSRVLFISGYTEEAVVRNGELATGAAFLQKPFTPLALLRKIREILNNEEEKYFSEA